VELKRTGKLTIEQLPLYPGAVTGRMRALLRLDGGGADVFLEDFRHDLAR
jgi:hypothetical protein